MNNEVNFGYKKVAESAKQKLVNDVFSAVSNRYDIMNDLMSMGLHRIWKRDFVACIKGGGRFLDLASGSGDIAIAIIKQAIKSGRNYDIILSDINEDMLAKAKGKIFENNLNSATGKIEFCTANAEQLPFVDNSFDYCTISFGLRNCTNIDNVLKEALRVLRPGGQFLCLEFSKPTSLIFGKIYDIYSFKLIPLIGEFIAKNKEAYEYLVESIRTFPDQEELKRKMLLAGFARSSYRNLSMGIVAIHQGIKMQEQKDA